MLSDGRGVLVCEVGYQEREQERPQNRPSAKSCRRYPRNALEGQATNYAVGRNATECLMLALSGLRRHEGGAALNLPRFGYRGIVLCGLGK